MVPMLKLNPLATSETADTERTRLPAVLRPLVALVRSAPQPLCLLAVSGREATLHANVAFEALLPLPGERKPLSLEEANALLPGLQEALAAGRPVTVERTSGTFTLSPVASEAGAIVWVLIAAQPAQPRASELLLKLSHDFRTPLTVLIGHAETLFEDAQDLPPDQRARLAALRRNAFRLSKSVESMLELSRANAGPRHARF